jgi:hypothetical protein
VSRISCHFVVRDGRVAAVEHGRAVGVPEHQLDWGD